MSRAEMGSSLPEGFVIITGEQADRLLSQIPEEKRTSHLDDSNFQLPDDDSPPYRPIKDNPSADVTSDA